MFGRFTKTKTLIHARMIRYFCFVNLVLHVFFYIQINSALDDFGYIIY